MQGPIVNGNYPYPATHCFCATYELLGLLSVGKGVSRRAGLPQSRIGPILAQQLEFFFKKVVCAGPARTN